MSSTYDSNGRFQSAYFGTSSTPDPVSFLVGQTSYQDNGLLSGLALGGTGPKGSTPTALFSLAQGYDGIQRVVNTSATEGSTTLFSQTRTYDNVGNALGLATTTLAQSGSAVSENEALCYDALSRLVWAGNSGTPSGGDHCMSAPSTSGVTTYSQSYSYDSLDRLTSGAPGTYSYGDTNHAHAATGVGSVPNPYAAYDAMGNMTCRNTDTTTAHTCAGSTPSGATMTYDNEGRLSSWSAPSGTSSGETYLYDNEGNQVLATTSQSGTPTDTIYFDNYTETVISGSTTTTTKYYSINGQRLAERVGSTLSYLISDLLGNVVMALNSSGTATAVELYEPYGAMNYSWGSMPTAHNYTGQRLDSQNGLLYYGFRWYDPLLGQFTRTDTKQNNANGMNPYAYVSDNPETKNDPTGHWDLGTVLAITAIAVVVAVVVVVAAPVVIAAAAAAAEVAVSAATAGVAAAAAGEGAVGIASAAVTMGYAASVLGPDIEAATDDSAALADNPCGDGLSFASTTSVATDHGQQAIGKLKVGAKVWSYNPQTKKMELEPVQKVWLNHDNDLVDLTLVTTVKGPHGKTTQQKEVLHTNKKHPFLTKEKGFVPVSQLKPGMHVREANGSYGVVATLTVVAGAMWMYNLTVAQDHTYIVGAEQWIVHNYNCGDQTPRGRTFTEHGAEQANKRGFTDENIDSIIDNNTRSRVKEIDPDTGDTRWRYQDKRGNTVITNQWTETIVTVYSHPEELNGGNYIPKVRGAF